MFHYVFYILLYFLATFLSAPKCPPALTIDKQPQIFVMSGISNKCVSSLFQTSIYTKNKAITPQTQLQF